MMAVLADLTSSCWMSRPTCWTWRPSSGWKTTLWGGRALYWWCPTTVTSWTLCPLMFFISTPRTLTCTGKASLHPQTYEYQWTQGHLQAAVKGTGMLDQGEWGHEGTGNNDIPKQILSTFFFTYLINKFLLIPLQLLKLFIAFSEHVLFHTEATMKTSFRPRMSDRRTNRESMMPRCSSVPMSKNSLTSSATMPSVLPSSSPRLRCLRNCKLFLEWCLGHRILHFVYSCFHLHIFSFYFMYLIIIGYVIIHVCMSKYNMK